MSLTTRYLLPLLYDIWPLLLPTFLVVLVSMLLYRRRNLHVSHAEDIRKTAAKRVIQFGDVGDSDDADQSDLVDPPHDEDVAHIRYQHDRLNIEESQRRADEFYHLMNNRRSIRFFSRDPVPRELVEKLVLTAGTGPSGAHTEPWSFVAVSDPDLKEQIRSIVEAEEEINYTKRMGRYRAGNTSILACNAVPCQVSAGALQMAPPRVHTCVPLPTEQTHADATLLPASFSKTIF
uniref:Nitroreductase domain-containing protein n=1 Tax=Scylla olivacea TaxID=85551 RepID=A0A0P4WHR2_SCYOL